MINSLCVFVGIIPKPGYVQLICTILGSGTVRKGILGINLVYL